MKILVLLISFCFIGPLEASRNSSCTTIDLNSSPKSPFKEIPIYDQDGVGNCYAYAGSQMVDYYRLKNGDKKYGLTNPIYASWLFNYKSRSIFKAKSLDGGTSGEIVRALKDLGACSEKEVQQKLSFVKKNAKLSDAELLSYLETIYKFFEYERTDLMIRDFKNISYELCKSSNDLQKWLKKSELFGIPSTLVLEEVFKGCKSNKVNVPELKNFSVGSDERMNGVIKSSLNKKLPAQIDICSTVIKSDPQFRGLYGILPPWYRHASGNVKSECNLHAVIISGQAKIGGECHYQIRNSWGSYWYPPAATSCACITRDGKYKAQCKQGEGVEYVGCWFKEKDIIPNVGGVNVFK